MSGPQLVPVWGFDDQEVSLWLSQLTDDEVKRLAFACLGMMVVRRAVTDAFSFTAPLWGLRFNIHVEAIDG